MQEALFLNKKISEIVKRGKTIFKSKIKWILALVLLTGCIYGSYTLSRYTEAAQVLSLTHLTLPTNREV